MQLQRAFDELRDQSARDQAMKLSENLRDHDGATRLLAQASTAASRNSCSSASGTQVVLDGDLARRLLEHMERTETFMQNQAKFMPWAVHKLKDLENKMFFQVHLLP